MKNYLIWGLSNRTLLAPPTNHSGNLSYYKSDENFGLNENLFVVKKTSFQQMLTVLLHIGGVLLTVFKILKIILLLWSHPRPYMI